MDIMPITETIADLAAQHPRHVKLFWDAYQNHEGDCTIYSLERDPDHDDGWDIGEPVCVVHDMAEAQAVVTAHNASVVAALSSQTKRLNVS